MYDGTVTFKPTSIDDIFEHAEHEYKFWRDQIEKNGYHPDDAIVMAQYVGMMETCATIAMMYHDRMDLRDRIEALDIKLFDVEFTDKEGS